MHHFVFPCQRNIVTAAENKEDCHKGGWMIYLFTTSASRDGASHLLAFGHRLAPCSHSFHVGKSRTCLDQMATDLGPVMGDVHNLAFQMESFARHQPADPNLPSTTLRGTKCGQRQLDSSLRRDSSQSSSSAGHFHSPTTRYSLPCG